MEFSFVLPRNNKDLLENDVSGYYVKNVFNPNEISGKLRGKITSNLNDFLFSNQWIHFCVSLTEAYQALQSKDAFYIFDHFDTFFSVIENAQQLQIQNLVRSIEILYKTTENLGQMLDNYLKQENLDRQHDFLNLLKMVIYLLVSNVRAADVFVKNNEAQAVSAGAGRKKSKQSNNDQFPLFANYETKRFDVLIQLYNVMQLPIEKLFNLNIVEEDFVK